MTDPNCARCGGTGSYKTTADAHRSAGIVPCYCEDPLPANHWLRVLAETPSLALTGVTTRGRIREAQKRAREVLELVKEAERGRLSEARTHRLAELLLRGGL